MVGFVPTLIRNGPANAMWYGVYELTRELQVKPGITLFLTISLSHCLTISLSHYLTISSLFAIYC